MTTPASSPLQELESLIRAGAARRWPSPLPEAVRTRLDEELAWLRTKPEAWHQAFLLACNRFASARELRRRLDVFRKIGHPINLAAIPLDDSATFGAFTNGNTDGIPAFQSFPMLGALREMRPRTLNDLALVYVLTLPGPCLFYNDFLRRRNTPAKTPSARAECVPHLPADAQCDNLPIADEPSHMGMEAGLRPAWLAALAETHGILLWQEQALILLRDLAGFSAEDAWQTLRALLKDKYTTLRHARPRFIKGTLANPTFGPALSALRTLLPGFADEPSTPDSIPTAPKALARRLWDDLLFFASTLYPKSHALARSLLAYRLLYLRLHNTLTPAPCPPPKRPTERPILDP